MKITFGITLFISLMFSLKINGQNINLCGIWYSYDYTCNPGSDPHVEVFAVSQNGTYVTATKIVGDQCVTAGHTTWEGNYLSTPFDVVAYVGSISDPNCCTVTGNIVVADSDQILFRPYNLDYFKYSCKELDSLNIKSSDYGLECGCESRGGSIAVPQAFTPNGDNIDELFYPFIDYPIEGYSFSIYNRWGQRVFFSTDKNEKWNGKFKNSDCDLGVYVWTLKYNVSGITELKQGNVTLIR